MSLLPLSSACALLGCRDPRTARRRLAALGVEVVTFGRRTYVDADEVERAIRVCARPLDEAGTAGTLRGVELGRGERLW